MGKHGRLVLMGGGITLVIAAAVWHFVADQQRNRPSLKVPAVASADAPSAVSEVRRTNTNPGYVGIQVCRECHEKRCDEFSETRHARAMCEAKPERLPESFATDHTLHQSPAWPYQFELTATSKGIGQKIRPKSSEEGEPREFSIDLVYGSQGKADEVYFTWLGNRLYELPFGWLHPQKVWGKQAYQDVGLDVLRATTPRCLECHTTFYEHQLGTLNEYRRDSLLLGVTCERCHGPGRDHVTHHREHPDDKAAKKITRPTNLSRERQTDVCGQCHSDALHHRGPLFSYPVGEPLEEHFRILLAEGIENDHVADQVTYMKQSKCYQEDEQLTCITCHYPHRPSDAAEVARACSNCHQASACGEQSRLPESLRERCVDCHMPRYSRVPIKFHTEDARFLFPMRPHQHRIGVYTAARDELVRDALRDANEDASREKVSQLTASLADYWLEQGNSLRATARFLPAIGAYREGLRVSPTEALTTALRETEDIQERFDRDLIAAIQRVAENRADEAVKLLDEMLKVAPQSAQVHAKLGTAYELLGQHDQAVKHWNQVAQCDPDNAYGHNMRGWTSLLAGRLDDAREQFKLADSILPHSAEIQYRWGLTEMKARRPQDAESHFREVLDVSPQHPGAMQGLSHVLRELGQNELGVQFAQRAAEATNFENIDILVSFADACLDVKREREAAEALQRARDLARAMNNLDLAAQLERRLWTLPGAAPRGTSRP